MRGMGGPTRLAVVTGCTGLRFSDGINSSFIPSFCILLPLKVTANTAVWFK